MNRGCQGPPLEGGPEQPVTDASSNKEPRKDPGAPGGIPRSRHQRCRLPFLGRLQSTEKRWMGLSRLQWGQCLLGGILLHLSSGLDSAVPDRSGPGRNWFLLIVTGW